MNHPSCKLQAVDRIKKVPLNKTVCGSRQREAESLLTVDIILVVFQQLPMEESHINFWLQPRRLPGTRYDTEFS